MSIRRRRRGNEGQKLFWYVEAKKELMVTTNNLSLNWKSHALTEKELTSHGIK